jgi:hypothetical protein
MVTELQVSASSFNKERKGCIGGTDGRQHGVLRVELCWEALQTRGRQGLEVSVYYHRCLGELKDA